MHSWVGYALDCIAFFWCVLITFGLFPQSSTSVSNYYSILIGGICWSQDSQLFPPLFIPPFWFLRYPWKCILTSFISPPSHLITLWCRDENYQSAVCKVHLTLCSELVSTFCCTRVDINHRAERSSGSSTCSPRFITSLSLCRLVAIEAHVRSSCLSRNGLFLLYLSYHFLSFRLCAITITHPGPLHMIVLYHPPEPPIMNVGLAAVLMNCLKGGPLLMSLCHFNRLL